MKYLIQFLNTLSYVTIIPVQGLITVLAKVSGYDEINLAGLAKYLPLVGILLGIILAFANMALGLIHIDILLKPLIITILWLVITGGLHFDGLMDTFDGLACHKDIEKTLEVMKDSRVGNFGVLSGIVIILVKFITLINLQPKMQTIALLILPGLARFVELYAIGKYKYLRTSGSGKIWHDTTKFPQDILLGLSMVIIGLIIITKIFQVNLVYLAASIIISGILITRYFVYKLGGHTGDTYGACIELTESLGLIVINIFFNCQSS